MVEEGENQHKISQKRMKSEETEEERGEDRISALPDYLLIEILCRLPSTKDAIKTGTLSKRWEHVWTSVHTLTFTSKDSSRIPEFPPNPNSRPDFFSLVDKTLTQCRQLNLKKFKVCSGYDDRFKSQVNNWIRYAISRGVEELNLGFNTIKPVANVLLDQNLFICSCLTDLTLSGCILNPTGEISWKNLKNLCISYGNLDEDLIENILSGSPVLEVLELGYGNGYKKLNITSKSVKKLVISGYMDLSSLIDDNNIIEVNAPDILSLTIQKGLMLWKFLLLNVSSLVKAHLDYEKLGDLEEEEEMLKGFILNLRHVKELKIGSRCSGVVSQLEARGFDFPSTVKFVERSK